MPYTIRKQKCKQSDGDSGGYTLSYTDNKGKKHRACHTSRKKAQGQIAAIEGPRESDEFTEGDMQMERAVRRLVRETLLREELTSSDKREIEKIARRQSEIVLSRELGPDAMKTIRDEVEKVTGKTLANKESKALIEELVIAVVKRLYKDITLDR